MKILHYSPFSALAICLALLAPIHSGAEDIDIFVGKAGTASAPNVIFLVDNSPNWSRQAQHWPDNGGTQGAAELAAISNILNSITPSDPVNIGLALLSEYAGSTANGAIPGTGGGYIRFGARDMSVTANRVALQNILAGIQANITDPNEKVGGMAKKDETAGFYEVYKYLSGLTPYTGDVANNVNADVIGNPRTFTGAGQGLNSDFALVNGRYQSPITTANACAKTFIIYIANNANNTGYIGQRSYEPNILSVGTALASPTGLDTWLDEWTRHLSFSGVIVPAGNTNGQVTTYILDAYKDQQNVGYSQSLIEAARQGGSVSNYYQVGSMVQIEAALKTILAQIRGENSTFASASLPVNTTNRSQNKNQVFIPMFRPDSNAKPLWMGNLKQYQFVMQKNDVLLGDVDGNAAVSSVTGFPNDCATSYWTSDSPYVDPNAPSTTPSVPYWSKFPGAKGNCPKGLPTSPAERATATSYDAFSDAPDGPFVEKGGVAEVIRKGNDPSVTNAQPTWAVNRNVLTYTGGGLAAFTAASSGLPATTVDFILGEDVNDENANGNFTETRPSLHGDAVHSRPTPVDYPGTTGVTVYYGANDGSLRAVDTTDGRERWAFIAPEFYSTLSRLQANSPVISYATMPAGVLPTPTPKNYYFDGSIGLYQDLSNSKIWIYPTMRRGGRMIYALDVTSPNAPVFKWKVGCPNLANDSGCTSGFSGIGQTWSIPQAVASIQGYPDPVIIVGGGYDNCEDANSATPSCGSAKGAGVYVLDANTGALLKYFATTRSVAADVAVLGTANAGIIDRGYVVDLGGNIYRMDFGTSISNWSMNRVAYSNGSGRKFFYPPALLPAPGDKVYLAIGSGDREHPLLADYPYANVTNRFYVYLDDLTSTAASPAINLDDAAVMSNFTTLTSCATASIFPTSSLKGWFMDLNQNGAGEQTVTSALIVGGMAVFSTNRPVPATPGSCANTLGQARGYWVNLFNGSGGIGVAGACGGARSSVFVGGGLPPSPVLGSVVINGKPVSVIIGAAQKDGTSSTTTGGEEVKPAITMKRKSIYWKSSGEN